MLRNLTNGHNSLKDTYIYVVTESWDKKLRGRQAVKVGVAKNPQSRIKELQVANARKLQLTMLIGPMGSKNAYSLEKALHRYLRRNHVNGEWFDFSSIKRLSKYTIPVGIQVETFHVEQTKTKRVLESERQEREAEKQLDREYLLEAQSYG